MKILLLFLISILMLGCAVSQEITLDGWNSENHGELVIQFSDNIRNVKVTLDDRLVDTKSATTKEIRLNHIPEGDYLLRVTASSWQLASDLNFEREINISSGQQSATIIAVPPKSGGYWALTAVMFTTSIGLLIYNTQYR